MGGDRVHLLAVALLSLLLGMALPAPVRGEPGSPPFQLASNSETASEVQASVTDFSSLTSSPARLATLNGSSGGITPTPGASISNVLVVDSGYFGGQGWDLGDDLFHTTADTTNFTPPDDPDFPEIASLLTDGLNESVELNNWNPSGGGSSYGGPESYWLDRNPDLIGMDVDFIRLVIHDFTYSPVSDGTQFSENYTWEIWGHPIFIVFYPPTDANGTYLIDRRYTNVNVSLAETGTAILEWNGANRSLNGSGTNWRLNMSGLANGVYTYRVWATNSTGAVFASPIRRLTVGVGIWSLRHATTGFFPSIAYDSNGSLRICFDGAGIGGMYGLIYGSFDSSGWRFTQVDASSAYAGQSCSVALDREGRPHISYIWGPDYNDNFYVRHASFDGTSWNLETIDHGYYTYTAIALDPVSDLPRIAYSPYSGGLRLATFNGSDWTIQVVDPSADGATVSLDIDPNGNPGIAYADWQGDAVRYARWTGSEWNISVVDHRAFGPSLKLDEMGSPHIAYLTRNGVMYASRNGATWSNETVDVKTFYSVALVLDAQDAPSIAYGGWWGGDLRYAAKNGTWTTQIVSRNYGGNGVVMALGPGGTPGIVFQSSLANGDLVYASTGPDTIPPSTGIQMTGTLGNGGWFRSSVRITLVPTDDVSVRNTTYRIDGGPWRVYSAPFDVTEDGNHTVEYYSTDDAGNSETIRTASLRIDSLAPAVSPETTGVVGRDGWYRSSVNVTLQANDAQSGVAYIEYQVDRGPWILYSGRFAVSGDGWHSVQYLAVDGAGNIAGPATIVLKIDSTPPSTSSSVLGTIGGSGWYTTSASVSLSATDTVIGELSITDSLDGGPWENYSHPVIIEEGRHVFSYRAEDMAGNVEAPHSVAIDVDTTPPTATITSPSVQAIVASNDLDVTWTATDATSGIDHFELTLDGGVSRDVDAAARSYTFSGVSDGSHTVELRAVDVAGNAAATARVLSVDSTNPVLSIISPGGGTVFTASSVEVTWTASDATSGLDHITISLDGGAATDFPAATSSLTFSNLRDGTHTTRVQAVDRAGNVATSSVTFRVDTGILSPSGPYGSSLLVGVDLAILAAIGIVAILVLRRRGTSPPREGT